MTPEEKAAKATEISEMCANAAVLTAGSMKAMADREYEDAADLLVRAVAITACAAMLSQEIGMPLPQWFIDAMKVPKPKEEP